MLETKKKQMIPFWIFGLNYPNGQIFNRFKILTNNINIYSPKHFIKDQHQLDDKTTSLKSSIAIFFILALNNADQFYLWG